MTLVEGWTEIPNAENLRGTVSAGPNKLRVHPDPEPNKVTFRQTLTATQVGTLDTFYLTTLVKGTTVFTEDHPRTAVATTWRFFRRPSVSHLNGNLYTASYELEIMP